MARHAFLTFCLPILAFLWSGSHTKTSLAGAAKDKSGLARYREIAG